jgi:alanine racemase
VGRISMNLTTIDLMHLDATVGEKVIVIDENSTSPVSLEKQAERAGIIPYDMLVRMNKEMFRKLIY